MIGSQWLALCLLRPRRSIERPRAERAATAQAPEDRGQADEAPAFRRGETVSSGQKFAEILESHISNLEAARSGIGKKANKTRG
jgi:hypothetical protein